MPELSDTAWTSIVLIVIALVSLIITIIMRNRFGHVKFPTPWGPVDISPNDAEKILEELLSDMDRRELEALLKFNNERNAPSFAELLALDGGTLDRLVHRGLVHDPNAEGRSYQPERLQLGRLGWHILKAYLKETPKGRWVAHSPVTHVTATGS